MFHESDIIVKTNHLVKQFPASQKRTLTACNDISLNVYQGKTLGIVGESGCGKSTLVRLLMQLETPTRGEILYRGQNIAGQSAKIRWQNRQHMQMVFQNPMESFNPRMKVLDILTEPLMNYGRLEKKDKVRKAEELLETVELPKEVLSRYPHSMSGGQRQRIGIARAISLEPEVLLCDESTSALDVSIQKNIIELLVRLQQEKGISMVFICHDIALLQSFAHQIAVMYLGHIMEIIPGELVRDHARHPYTQTLLEAIFSVHMDPHKKITEITGDVPSPLEIPPGCPFQNRCRCCTKQCGSEKPRLKEIAPGHLAACHRLR